MRLLPFTPAAQSIPPQARSLHQYICLLLLSARPTGRIPMVLCTDAPGTLPASSWRNASETSREEFAGAAFGSGMAAIMSVFQALSPGDHVIAPLDIYHGTAGLLRGMLARWNLQTSFVEMTDIDEVRRAMNSSTRLIMVETPSNPLLKITDIAAVAEVAHQHGITCVCDNTWASPALQRCLALGADLVVHSTTKYLGGHGDVTGGMVVSARRDGLFEEIRKIQQQGGGSPISLRLLAGSQGHPDPALPHAGPLGKCRQGGQIP